MPRDVNGNFTLYQPGNPVQTDTVIESTWANNTLSDIEAEITDSLSRSGKGALTAPFQIIDKQTGIPGLAFGSEPTSGFKREGSGDVRIQVLGVDAMRFTPSVQYAYSDGTLKQIAVEEPALKIMRGSGGLTSVFFYNTGVPTGWDLANPDGNVRSLMVGGAGGSTGGTLNPTSLSDTVNITIMGTTSPGGLHVHTTDRTFETKAVQSGTGINVVTNDHTHDVNQGGSHPHDFNGSDSDTFTLTPRYAMGVIGRLAF